MTKSQRKAHHSFHFIIHLALRTASTLPRRASASLQGHYHRPHKSHPEPCCTQSIAETPRKMISSHAFGQSQQSQTQSSGPKRFAADSVSSSPQQTATIRRHSSPESKTFAHLGTPKYIAINAETAFLPRLTQVIRSPRLCLNA